MHHGKRMANSRKVTRQIYESIDNELYHATGEGWWQSDSPFYLIQSSINPARVGYFRDLLFHTLKLDPKGRTALEVGCGGGVLCEEIARMGFDVTGIDPSEDSLQIAATHAKVNRLRVKYEKAVGEAIPYRDNSTDGSGGI